MKRASSLTRSFSLSVLLSAMLLGACTGAPPSTTPSEPPSATEESTESTEIPVETPRTTATKPSTPDSPTAQAPSRATNNAPIRYDRPVEVYWLTDEDSAVGLMSVPMTGAEKTADPAAQLQDAMEMLLAGPDTQDDRTTTIPAQTQLKGLELQKDGVHVDLSSEFTTGGGTLSMTSRLAQILYTATSSNPEGQVWLKVDGDPLEVLGGEGLVLEQPLTRAYFEDNFDL